MQLLSVPLPSPLLGYHSTCLNGLPFSSHVQSQLQAVFSNEPTHFLMNVFRTFVLCIYPAAISLFHHCIIIVPSFPLADMSPKSVHACVNDGLFNGQNIHLNSHYSMFDELLLTLNGNAFYLMSICIQLCSVQNSKGVLQ